MKRIIKLAVIAVFSVAAVTAASLCSSPVSVAASEADSPRTLYVQNCARCHGADGKAQTALGKKLDANDITGHISTAKVIRTVTNGKGDMPSFKKRLTAAQIKSIAGYVHSSL